MPTNHIIPTNPQFKDLTGQTFYRWTVLSFAYMTPAASWNCQCRCGTIRVVAGTNLKQGYSKSCGCWSREAAATRCRTHGGSKLREFIIWKSMNGRCKNTRNRRYHQYGGRGIKVEWNNFEEFYRDMGPRTTPKHTIERKDNDGNYCKENCVWATRRAQANNRRTNRIIVYGGKQMTMTEWARSLGIRPNMLGERLRAGWSIEQALTKPPRRLSNHIGRK